MTLNIFRHFLKLFCNIFNLSHISWRIFFHRFFPLNYNFFLFLSQDFDSPHKFSNGFSFGLLRTRFSGLQLYSENNLTNLEPYSEIFSENNVTNSEPYSEIYSGNNLNHTQNLTQKIIWRIRNLTQNFTQKIIWRI